MHIVRWTGGKSSVWSSKLPEIVLKMPEKFLSIGEQIGNMLNLVIKVK